MRYIDFWLGVVFTKVFMFDMSNAVKSTLKKTSRISVIVPVY